MVKSTACNYFMHKYSEGSEGYVPAQLLGLKRLGLQVEDLQ